MTIDIPWLQHDSPGLGVFEGQRTLSDETDSATIHYDPVEQRHIIKFDGAAHKQTAFLWKRMDGDFILHARASVIAGVTGLAWGMMARSSLEHDAVFVAAINDGERVQLVQSAGGAEPQMVESVAVPADVLQLARSGNTFSMKVAQFGETFGAAASIEVVISEPVYVGLFVDVPASAKPTQVPFSNVRIVVPADDTSHPRECPLGSHLEILDVGTGERQIIYSSSTPFEAPNWTPDGQALIYNSEGRLYRFDLATGLRSLLETGFATRNNNDHVLSFDGTMLGMSDHTEEGHSIVYVVPVEGGTPRRLTAQGPSYMHGWSPDGAYLVYTGQRGGEYDIYRIDVEGGEETRLTTAPGLDDGPEYTPDGRFIYFNSVRSDTMQIWRMAADGSGQEQMTDDEYNNWFPHVSPDGQQIVFLSYLPDVAPSAHPPYKHVYLRTMPIDGGEPTVVAYLYGGQGTINVPSWSPGGRRLAFVSNTGME
jgi:hypothetical protein